MARNGAKWAKLLQISRIDRHFRFDQRGWRQSDGLSALTQANVMVIQMGARRNYIYAEQLERAGLLHSLVTDLAWPAQCGFGSGRILAQLAPALAGAVARRTVVGVSAEKLKVSALPNLAHALLRWHHPEERFAITDEALAVACRLSGMDGARIIVNYLGNGGSFLDYAKARGAKIVTDFICMPSLWEIEEQERNRWPAWGGAPIPQRVIDRFRARMRHLLALSDVYLCPSSSVANDLARLPEFDPTRVRLTPYGAGGLAIRPAQTVPGRVLFAGAAMPRKGLPYLGLAATQLRHEGLPLDVVVAGEATPVVRQQPEVRDIRFLGVLDRSGMAEELALADVFCLPSLTEGSSSAIFEALACGLPVVTTPSSGSVVRDGVEGLIVPERSAEATAVAIRRIVEDRELRQRMSVAALAAASRYSDESCGAAFVSVIRELQRQ